MKKLASLCAVLALGAGMLCAAVPAAHRAAAPSASHRQLMRSATANRYVASTPLSRTMQVPGGYTVRTSGVAPFSTDIRKAPSRISDAGSTVYASIAVAPDLAAPRNIAEIFLDGKITTLPVAFPEGPNGGPMQITGLYVRNGNFVCFVDEIFTGQYIYGSHLIEIAPDGTVVSSKEYSNSDYRFTLMAYDPWKDMIYGYVVIENTMYYATASGNNPLDVTLGKAVTPVDWPMAAMTYNQITDKLVGIAGSSVVEIDTATGEQKKIGSIDTPSEYITGLAYSPYDAGYFYAVSTDAANGIQLLDETSFKTLSYEKYEGLIGFYNFYCPDLQRIYDESPAEATVVNTIFGNGALSGGITYRMPSATMGGTPILGDIDYILQVDGVETQRGKAAAGSEFFVPVTDLTEGMHTFTLKVSTGGKTGPFLTTSFYVGNDTPEAPASVTITDNLIKWDAVTAGVHGGYVNPEEITYNVYVNDAIVAQGIKATECSPKLPQGEILDSYVASVEAVFDGKVSERTNSDDLKYGDPYPLPEAFEPTPKESKLFTIVDANNDGTAIELVQMRFGSNGVKDVFMYTSHKRNNANDWLYLPVTKYDDINAVYEFSMNAMRGSNKPETLEVVLAAAPDGQSSSIVKTIVPNTTLTNNSSSSAESLQNRVGSSFTVPSAGNYYIGIHITSARNRDRVIMRDFQVSKMDGIAVGNPAAVTSLKATAAPQGELKADVTFNFPTATIAGIPYAADKTLKATVKARGCEEVTVEGTPGSAASVAAPARQGDNRITVTVTDGELKGLSDTVDVYVGVEAPAPVSNLTGIVDATDYKMHLSWDAPTKGINGGYIQPTGIRYYLVEYKFVDGTYKWVPTEDLGTDVTEYDYVLPEGSDLQLVQVGILTENFAGTSDSFRNAAAVMGKPHQIPMTYNLRAAETFQTPTVNYSEDVELRLGDPADEYSGYATEDNAKALYSYSYFDLDDAYLTLPKFSTKGSVNAAVALDVYGGSTTFSVVASAYGVPAKVIKTFAKDDFTEKGPQKVTVDLPAEFQNKGWVEIGIRYTVSYDWFGDDSDALILYSYSFFDNVPYDFGITAIEGPARAEIGVENVYTAHVMNYGSAANTMPASNWKFTDAEGNVVNDVNLPAGTKAVASGDEITFDIAFTPTADQIGSYTLAYTIFRSDDKESNDYMERQFEVGKGVVPVVTDLHANEITFDNVQLGWSPISGSSNVLEDFEEETPLVFDDESDTVAGFTRIDGDGQMVYGPNSQAYQDQPYANQPQSFVVWSETDMEKILQFGDKSPYTGTSGDKFLIAFCPGPDPGTGKAASADDWLISPEIVGGSIFSFSMKPLTYQYGPETVEIMYSTTGTAKEDFTLLETVKTDVGEGSTVFEEYEFRLPENAKYVAIHYVSNDVFGIIIDDIGYALESDALKLSGFDIYRDGRLIAECAKCDGNIYDDPTVEPNKDYSYVIVPVLSDNSKGAESNTLTLRTTGVDGIVTDAAEAEYFDLNGIRVIGKPAAPGVYLEKKGDTIRKVVITK